MKNKILSIIVVFIVFGCSPNAPTYTAEDFQCYPDVVYLIRHAEKQIIKGEKNPELTKRGFSRAEALADSLAPLIEGIVYSSELTRSQQTVIPLAKKWNVDLKIHRAGDPSGQVAKAVSHCGKSVIIAGHSNTVPGLIKLFGIKDEVTIEDSQYGDLYMIRWENKSPVLSITFVGDKNSDE